MTIIIIIVMIIIITRIMIITMPLYKHVKIQCCPFNNKEYMNN